MKIKLYSIWDSLSEENIIYFVSKNRETAKREFARHIIDQKTRNPMIKLDEFTLIEQIEIESSNTRIGDFGEIIEYGQSLWDTLQKEIDKTNKTKNNNTQED